MTIQKSDSNAVSTWYMQIWSQLASLGIINLSIIILSVLSFITTSEGISLLFPEGPLYKISAYMVSAVFQLVLLQSALFIKQCRETRKWVLVYIIPAFLSISCSYIYLFQSVSGEPIEHDKRLVFFNEYNNYLISISKRIALAKSIVTSAIAEADSLLKKEITTGGTQPLKRLNRYLIHKEGSHRYADAVRQGGEGIVADKLRRVINDMQQDLKKLDSYEGIVAEKAEKDVEKIQLHIDKLQSRIVWPVIKEIVTTKLKAGEDFMIPQAPQYERLAGGESAEQRSGGILWALQAFDSIITDWNWRTIGIPLVIAIALDLFVLLIAVLFRDTEVFYRNQIGNLQLAYDSVPIPADQKLTELKNICYRLNSGGKQNSRWYRLSHDDLDRLSNCASALAEKFYGEGIIQHGLFRNYYRIPKPIKDELYKMAGHQVQL